MTPFRTCVIVPMRVEGVYIYQNGLLSYMWLGRGDPSIVLRNAEETLWEDPKKTFSRVKFRTKFGMVEKCTK